MLAVIHREEIVTGKGKKKKVVIAKELPFGIPGGENEDLFEALRDCGNRLPIRMAFRHISFYRIRCCICSVFHGRLPSKHSGEISGIGEFKKKKYGKEFVNLIKQFV